jgi:hypothetical protein
MIFAKFRSIEKISRFRIFLSTTQLFTRLVPRQQRDVTTHLYEGRKDLKKENMEMERNVG